MRDRAGIKLNLIVVFGVLGLAAIAILLVLSQNSPDVAGEQFMKALAKKDVNKLVELSYMENPSAPLKDQWADTVNNKARTYVFLWVWESSRRQGDEAVLLVHLIEFKGPVQSDSETFELPLVRKEGKWKVDLRSLSRKFFPALPR